MPWEQLFPIVPEAVFFASIRKAVAATLDTAADHGGPGRVAGFYVCPAPGSALVNRTACRRRAWDDVAAVLPNLARELLWEVEGSRVAENVLLQARQQCGKVSRSCAEPQNAARCWRSARLRALEYMAWKRHALWRHCALNVAKPSSSGLATSCHDERSCDRLWHWLESCFRDPNARAYGANLPLMMPSGLRANEVSGLNQTSEWIDSLHLATYSPLRALR